MKHYPKNAVYTATVFFFFIVSFSFPLVIGTPRTPRQPTLGEVLLYESLWFVSSAVLVYQLSRYSQSKPGIFRKKLLFAFGILNVCMAIALTLSLVG